MKKALIVTSFLVISALAFAPSTKAFSIDFSKVFGEKNERPEKCGPNFHAGNEVEEEHESEQAKIHEREDGEDCTSPSPTATAVSIPTGTPGDVVPTATPVGTPIETPTTTATATPTVSPTADQTAILQGLINQLRALIQKLTRSLEY